MVVRDVVGLAGNVTALQFGNVGYLGCELFGNRLQQLVGSGLASAAVFGSGEERPEVERRLPDRGNGQVGAFQNGLQPLQQGLGLLSTFLDVHLEGLQLLVCDLVLVFGREFQIPLLVARLPLGRLPLDLVGLVLELALVFRPPEDVRLEELVLSLDLLVVLLDGFESLGQLLQFQVAEVLAGLNACCI